MYNSSEILNHDLPITDKSLEAKAEMQNLIRSVKHLNHDLFFLYLYLATEGCYEDACNYLELHEESTIPFPFALR